jgi:hypothetical protein
VISFLLCNFWHDSRSYRSQDSPVGLNHQRTIRRGRLVPRDVIIDRKYHFAPSRGGGGCLIFCTSFIKHTKQINSDTVAHLGDHELHGKGISIQLQQLTLSSFKTRFPPANRDCIDPPPGNLRGSVNDGCSRPSGRIVNRCVYSCDER